MSETYYLIEETTWNVSPKSEDIVGTDVFVRKMRTEEADLLYQEDGVYQNDEHVAEAQPSEDGYPTEAKSYCKIEVDEEEAKKYKKIIKKYNRLRDIF